MPRKCLVYCSHTYGVHSLKNEVYLLVVPHTHNSIVKAVVSHQWLTGHAQIVGHLKFVP